MYNFSWVEPGAVAGSSRPGWLGDLAEDLRFLDAHGIRAVVGFLEPGTTLDYGAAPGVQLETLVLQVEDHTAPALELIERGLDFIDACLGEQRPVAVHCLAGIGRTGTLLACFLVRRYRLGGDAAIARLRSLRPGAVETIEQEERVREFAARLRSGSGRHG